MHFRGIGGQGGQKLLMSRQTGDWAWGLEVKV